MGSRAIGAHHLASPRRAVPFVAASMTTSPTELAEWITANGGDVSAVRVDMGERGRGLFAARDVAEGEAVLRVPVSLALNDGVAPAPYPGAPWSVTLAAAILTARDGGEESPWARYVASLPRETIGFANSPAADDPASVEILFDDAASDELERYLTLLRGSHRAMTMMRHEWTLEEWRWAMSQVHSRTFRVEEPSTASGQTRRLMVPFIDLLNHDSREGVWQCDWDCEWELGGGGGDFVVRAKRDVAEGEEVLVSYGERCDRHFCVFFGFLPEPNPHNGVALFRNLEEAAEFYEKLCDDGENAAEAWSRARETAVATVRAEETSNATATETSSEGDEDREWTSADAEAEEEAALRVGANATVDDRLLRLFEILSGDADVAVAAARIRAARMLEEMDESDAGDAGDAGDADEALALAAAYRRRRRALLEDIA